MGLLKYLLVTVCLSWQIGSALSSKSRNCYHDVDDACTGKDKIAFPNEGLSGSKLCTAELGAFPRLTDETNTLISTHLIHSIQYMFQASYFNEWNMDRPGFHAYFSKLSDEEWDSAISLMLHMVQRGGRLTVNFRITIDENWQNRQNELHALSTALDLEKEIAIRTLQLAHQSKSLPKNTTTTESSSESKGTPKEEELRDAAFANFLSERLNDQTFMRIKHLSNYVNMLSQVFQSSVDKAYALFVFDHEILK